MPAKKSRSRFTDLVKFVPDDTPEPINDSRNGIKTNVLSESKSTNSTYIEEPIDEDDIPEIGDYSMDEEDDVEEKILLDQSDDTFDPSSLVDEVKIEEDDEEDMDEEEFEEDDENIEEEPQAEINYERGKDMEKSNFSEQIKNVNETIILGNTTIKGDIITDTGIQIYGAVLGNIESGGRVQVVGKVEGDITGRSVIITNTNQTGNINAENDVSVKEGCVINGNISAEKINLRGTVIGDIEARGQVDFESGSEIKGNVSAHSFNIKPGAKINGTISTN